MGYIYVLSRDGSPLMPTLRRHHVEKLLRRGKARVVEHVPFVIQLMYDSPCVTQPLYGGTDPGRTNIGNAVMGGRGTVVYKDHVTTRNKEIAKLMAERKKHRQASRRGERLARKRLAKKLGTTMKAVLERVLPGCDGPVRVKDIINTEARFNNRNRPNGWVTPSVKQLIRTHVNMARRIRKYLPVDHWTLEVNKFAFMQLDDGSVYGTDFQNGKLRGYRDVKDYIWYLQEGKCLYCKKEPIEHYRHILPGHKGGNDRWYNLAGLCTSYHDKVHRGEISLKAEGTRRRIRPEPGHPGDPEGAGENVPLRGYLYWQGDCRRKGAPFYRKDPRGRRGLHRRVRGAGIRRDRQGACLRSKAVQAP